MSNSRNPGRTFRGATHRPPPHPIDPKQTPPEKFESVTAAPTAGGVALGVRGLDGAVALAHLEPQVARELGQLLVQLGEEN